MPEVIDIYANLDDADAERKMQEFEAEAARLEAAGVHVKLYMDLQQTGASEEDIKSGFKNLGLNADQFKQASDAARTLNDTYRGVNQTGTQNIKVTSDQANAIAQLNKVLRDQADAEARVSIATTRNAQGQMRQTVSVTRQQQQIQAGGAATTFSDTDRAVIYDQAQAAKLAADAVKQQEAAFNAAAREGDSYDQTLRRLSNAEFEASVKGKPMEEQLRMLQERMLQVGVASDEFPKLEGRVASLNAKLEQAPEVGTLEYLREQLQEARDSFDGTEESIQRLRESYEEYNKMLEKSKNATGEMQKGEIDLGYTFERQIVRIGIGILVWTTLRVAQEEIVKTIAAMEEYSIAVAQFASITDQSVGEATEQFRRLEEAGVKEGFAPKISAPGIMQAARYEKNPQQQEELFSKAAQLSSVLGLKDTERATEALGSAMAATGRSAADMGDLIYAGFKQAAGSADELMGIIPKSKTLSDEMGMGFERVFAIITKGASDSDQTVSSTYQVLNRFTETVNNLSGDKLIDFVNGFRQLGMDVLDSNNNLKSTGDIITDLGSRWQGMSATQRTQAIDLLGGEKLRGDLRNAAEGILGATKDIDTALKNLAGALDRGAVNINGSFGHIVEVVKANVEELRSQGKGIEAFITEQASILLPTFAQLAGQNGRSGALAAQGVSNIMQFGFQGGMRMTTKQMLDEMTGMKPEDARQYFKDIIGEAFQGPLGGIMNPFKDATDQQIDEILKGIGVKFADAGKTSGQNFVSGVRAAFANIGNVVSGALRGATASATAAGTHAASTAPLTPQEEMRTRIRQQMGDTLNTFSFKGVADIFPTQEMDLTKYTQQEINQAKQLSVQISNEELQVVRQQAMALGLTKEEVDKVVSALERELDGTIKLLQTREGLNYEIGKTAANLDKALQQQENEKRAAESNFQFRRLRDVDPSQFGELQSRAQMYNNFLSRIGSPEKEQRINLLLGEQNVFKTMNVRMTALQMALEDLTKVEKAQLSGTWNLPAGATALVPISSLDLQRWNSKGGAGGIDPSMLAALGNATTSSGDKVVTSVDRASNAITAAIRESLIEKGITPTESGLTVGTKDARSAVLTVLGGLLGIGSPFAGALENEPNRTISPATRPMQPWYEQYAPPAGADRSYDAIERTRSTRQAAAVAATPPVNVSISALPIKAMFNANLMVLLNGQVVARALTPILYQMLARTTASVGMRPKGTVR